MSEYECIGGEIVPIEGEVYCLTHGAVHDDTLDPYQYGYQSCLTEADGSGVGITKAMVHRRLCYRAKKGDWRD